MHPSSGSYTDLVSLSPWCSVDRCICGLRCKRCGPARENGDALAMVAPAKPGGSVRTLAVSCPERSYDHQRSVQKQVQRGEKPALAPCDAEPYECGDVHAEEKSVHGGPPDVFRLSKPVRASNLDATGTRVVRKGDRVQWSAWPMRVQRVRLGVAYCRVEGLFGGLRDGIEIIRCSDLRVLA